MFHYSRALYYARVYYEMLLQKRIVTSYAPEYIGVEITNVCNFRCVFCPQSNPRHHEIVPKAYMNEEALRIVFGKIRAAGVKTDTIHWTLDGEPFMNGDFSKLCRIGCEYNFRHAHFASNGMLCTPERLQLFPLEQSSLAIAIDFCADSKYFETVRGIKGSWETIRRNICAILNDERFGNVRFEITDISSFQVRDKQALATNYEALKALFAANPKRIMFRTRTFHNATGFLAAQQPQRQTGYHLCPYPWTALRVAANGDVVACCRDLQHKTVVGNILKQEVMEIWNGKGMQALRRNLLNRKPESSAACKNCDMPYDSAKFSLKNILMAAKGRLQLFR